jgi:serine/threonine protein kinase/WD40 repeat protein
MRSQSDDVARIFGEAAELQNPAERAAYLDGACGQDARLRAEVEQLLHHDDAAGSFLDRTNPPGLVATLDELTAERPGAVIGPYKLLEQIGEGGFGVVFMAEQTRPVRRKVALKVIKPGMDTRQVIARFEAERQALALMEHPNIARVLDAGTTPSPQPLSPSEGERGLVLAPPPARREAATDAPLSPVLGGEGSGVRGFGRPYFVMELVRGLSMTDYCDQNNLPIRERLELFVTVCQAVQHAHQKGIIHRDIKPSNVLVTLHDGKPVVKVIDFGVAKALGQQLTDKTLFTNFAQMIGTPLYMSPEQAEWSGLDVDTRSDIYSLGVLLYELLTGTTPFDKERLKQASFDEIRRIIREEEPPKPSTRMIEQRRSGLPSRTSTAEGPARQAGPTAQAATTAAEKRRGNPLELSRLFRAELDWIVMKALEKDRNRRYETANGLAMDVQRYLHDEPVLACPPSVGYRLRKFGRKNGTLLATAAAFAVLLITLAVGASLFAWSTDRQLQETRKAQDETKLELYRSLVAQARANRLSRRTGRRVHSLEILAEATRLAKELQLPEDDFLELRNETIACLPLVDLQIAKSWESHPAGTVKVDFDDKLEHYVGVDDLKNVATVRRVADDSAISRIPEFWQSTERRSEQHSWVVLSPDGEFLGRIDNAICTVWRVTSRGTEVLLPKVPGVYLGFSPDCRRLAIISEDGAISVYELPSGKRLKQWQTSPVTSHWGHPAIAFHPEKPHLAVRNLGKITILDMDTGNKLAEFVQPGGVDALAWHPDGKRLASADLDGCIYLWDAYTGRCLDRLTGHTDYFIRLAIHPAGELLASTCRDRTLRLWDIPTGREVFKTTCDTTFLYAIQFSGDGRFLAADLADHQLRLWEMIPPCGYRSLVREPHLGKGNYLGLAASGKHPLLAVGMEDGVGLWELPGGRPLAVLPGGAEVTAFEPSGALLASGSAGQLRYAIETIGPAGTLRIGPAQPLPFPPSIHNIAISPDGRVMASAQGWGALVWHADKGDQLIKLAPQYDVRSVAISPEGEWVATGSHFQTDVYVKVWESGTGRHVADLPVETSSRVAFSPDGRWLLTTGGGFRLWEVATWREGPKIGGSFSFAFSPDSKILAVETGSGVVRLLDPDTGREYARLEDPNQDKAANLAFSPDWSQLFASTRDSPAVHVWDLRAIRAELAPRGLDWELPPYAELGDSKDAPPLRVTVASHEQGIAHVNSGEWEEAARDYGQLAEANPDDHWCWYHTAPLCLQAGKRQEYRRICREMLARFGNTDKLEIADRTAKACSLAPEAVSDFGPVLKLTDRVVTGTEEHRDYRWFVLTKGLAEYRAGHYAVAVDWLNRFSPRAGGVHQDATAFAVLAMAKHQLGLAPGADAVRLAAEARAALGHAQAILADKMPDPKEGRPFDSYFHDWLHAQILVREAEKLIGKDDLGPMKQD